SNRMGATRKRRGCEWLSRRFHRARAQGAGAQEDLNIFSCFRCGDGLGSHCKKGTDEQNASAPKLRVGKSFAKKPGRQPHRDRWAKELKTLREADSDFTDRQIIQNVGERNTGYRREDQNQVRLCASIKRCADFAERKSERK